MEKFLFNDSMLVALGKPKLVFALGCMLCLVHYLKVFHKICQLLDVFSFNQLVLFG